MEKPIFLRYFNGLKDKRSAFNRQYSLEEILFLVFVATLADVNTLEEMEDFGAERLDFLRQYLPFKHGTPSADTLRRVLAMLDAREFERCFVLWAQSLKGPLSGVIAIDGKSVCGSGNATEKPLHLLNAFAAETHLVLGQLATDVKSNEITAIPELVELLSIKGMVVTLDAMGCQKSIARVIRQKDADYVLALKKNHGDLYDDVTTFFKEERKTNFSNTTVHQYETVEKDHGRLETRTITVSSAIDWLTQKDEWQGLQTLVEVHSTRESMSEKSQQTRYFLTSLPPQPQMILAAVRAHWRVENPLHWSLDVTFAEDDNRTRHKNIARNHSLIRKAALNTLKLRKPQKQSLQRARKSAARSQKHLANLLIP